jgi:hypothetical protein
MVTTAAVNIWLFSHGVTGRVLEACITGNEDNEMLTAGESIEYKTTITEGKMVFREFGRRDKQEDHRTEFEKWLPRQPTRASLRSDGQSKVSSIVENCSEGT